MKRIFSILFLIIVFGISTAYAQPFWVGSVFNDNIGSFVPNIVGFDWSSSGSGNAEGVGPPGTPLVVGTQFDLRYQSYLFSLTDPNGQTVSFPGLNTNFEYTVVAKIPEEVLSTVSINPSTTSLVFKTLAGGQFFIYHDAFPNANVGTGFGFDDGNLVASGTIGADQISSFIYNSLTGIGLGSTILTGIVTYANPAFLDPAISIFDFRFESTLNYPPLDSATPAFFSGRNGEGNFPAYTVASDDISLKVDGSSKFSEGPCIDIEKEISIDGGITWLDADDVDTAAKATAPHGAVYRLIVTNCGNVDLTNVIINDPALGITNYLVGNLAAGASVTLTSGEIPELDVSERCSTAGAFDNTACVIGTFDGVEVSDCDPAWLVCTPPPCIDLEKQISIDDGVTWLDADTVDAAAVATAPHGALYRLIVTNCGDVDLTNVLINDPTLGIINYPVGNLLAGTSITLTSGEIPQLDVPERCSTAGSFENTSCVTGSANGAEEVEDCDPAWLVCEQPPTGACRMTHGSVTVNQDGTYTLDGPYAETTQPKPQSSSKKNAKSSSNNTTPTPYYTVGGQIGAPQANDPSYGEWEHQQHDHPTYGSFGFHAGTASASPGTEISSVECADPGWCENARCAPFKQIYWDGIGEFENMSLNNPFPGCTVRQKSHRQGGTLHYMKAHAGDFGEPGGNFPPGDGPQPSEALCGWVSGGTDINNNVNITTFGPGPLHGDKGSQVCDECPDWYEIEIHCTTDPNSPIIYQVHDFIDRGNIQIHPEVSQQCPAE